MSTHFINLILASWDFLCLGRDTISSYERAEEQDKRCFSDEARACMQQIPSFIVEIFERSLSTFGFSSAFRPQAGSIIA
jgi:hypothetical protein